MRGSQKALRSHSPILLAPILLASAAVVVGAIGTPVLAHRQDDLLHGTQPGAQPPLELALAGLSFASLRLSAGPAGSEAVALPRPLDGGEAERIRRIFALQAFGHADEAARDTAALHDETLLPDILADRALQPGLHPTRAELTAWLGRWPGHPDAPRIRRRLADLANPRSPANDWQAPPAMRPAPVALPSLVADPAQPLFRRNRLLDRTIQERLQQGASGARSALRLVSQTRFPDPLYASALRAEIAQALFALGDDASAAQVARTAAAGAQGRVGLADFVGGLAAWRQGRQQAATRLFEAASRGDIADAGLQAGGAFWAARGHAAAGDAAGTRAWLGRAASFRHSFYGLLAGHVLDGPDPAAAQAPVPGTPVLGEIDVQAVAALPDGRRMFALLQVGQTARAEAALRALWPSVRGNAALCRSVALVARAAGMHGLSAQLAAVLQVRDRPGGDRPVGDRTQVAAARPMPRLQPRRGFTVNPALVYALTRVESNFDSRAVSGAGAHGLMQVMPVTARFMQDQAPAGHPEVAISATRLHNPGVNLEFGQDYVIYLSGQEAVRGDLIRLLASYNAGPNALANWNMAGAGGDPLLYVESLPNTETRDFVHRALTYLWIYSGRMHLPAPSLDTLARGDWPRFEDEQRYAHITPAAFDAAD